MPIRFRRHTNISGRRWNGVPGNNKKTAAEKVTIETKTVIGKAELTTFVLEPILLETYVVLPFEKVN